jgi:hypothetical protein
MSRATVDHRRRPRPKPDRCACRPRLKAGREVRNRGCGPGGCGAGTGPDLADPANGSVPLPVPPRTLFLPTSGNIRWHPNMPVTQANPDARGHQRTPGFRPGVKWSQVQTLSARPEKLSLTCGYSTETYCTNVRCAPKLSQRLPRAQSNARRHISVRSAREIVCD